MIEIKQKKIISQNAISFHAPQNNGVHLLKRNFANFQLKKLAIKINEATEPFIETIKINYVTERNSRYVM